MWIALLPLVFGTSRVSVQRREVKVSLWLCRTRLFLPTITFASFMSSEAGQGSKAPENLLRRRMNILERAASKAAGHNPSDRHNTLSPTSHSRSSLDDFEDESDDSSYGERSPTAEEFSGGSHMESDPHVSSRSWYQFDLAVLAALVSPIGHMLTGGDHVKNLFFILFLIFYLHQIIEGDQPRFHSLCMTALNLPLQFLGISTFAPSHEKLSASRRQMKTHMQQTPYGASSSSFYLWLSSRRSPEACSYTS